MSGERLFSPANPWFAASVGATVAIAALAAVAGFIWFPSLEPAIGTGGLWDAICAAAGVPRAAPASRPAPAAAPGSEVVLTQGMLDNPGALSIGRGATLALQCAICHGVHRVGAQIDTPNLAGQFAPAIYKQLQDFKSGARTNAVMSPQVANLTEQDMLDLASYFAYLPRVSPPVPAPVPPRIVESGAPMRNIPPCGACHGTIDTKPGSPWLHGESANYVHAQLNAFADGTRRNDISEQMRNIARNLTPAEIDEIARYFAAFPTE
ncbi:MAG TPA: c-type cytochrome [Aliidongia sp.]|nr:c-type cytochrome [Aliidongia sp.]